MFGEINSSSSDIKPDTSNQINTGTIWPMTPCPNKYESFLIDNLSSSLGSKNKSYLKTLEFGDTLAKPHQNKMPFSTKPSNKARFAEISRESG